MTKCIPLVCCIENTKAVADELTRGLSEWVTGSKQYTQKAYKEEQSLL